MWALGVVGFAAILGMHLHQHLAQPACRTNIQKELAKFGAGSIITPTGYLSFVFILFIFAVCLFVCSQTGAARQEEADQQLETLLALPTSRYRWLGGRLHSSPPSPPPFSPSCAVCSPGPEPHPRA